MSEPVAARVETSNGSASPDEPQAISGALRKGGALAISAQAIKLVLQLSSIAILARIVSPADFGLLSLITPLIAFFYVFKDIGLTAATIYVEGLTHEETTSLFWVNSIAGLILAGVVLCAAPVAAQFYNDPRLVPTLSVMSLTFVCNGIAAQYQALFQRNLRFRIMFVIEVSSNIAGTAAGLVVAYFGFGYWALVVMPVVTQACSLAVSVLCSSWHPGRPRWQRRTLMMMKFGSAVSGFNVLNYFARNIDNLLIGKVWGLEQLGFYGRAYSLMMAPLSQVIYPLNQIAVPVLTRVNKEKEQYVRAYANLMRIVMLVCVPLVTTLLVARQAVIHILLGPGWGAVAPIFLALGLSALVQPMNNSAGWIMLSQGRSKDVFWWGVIGAGLTVASILFGLQWGALAVAISYSAVQITIVTPLLWWFACRNRFVQPAELLSVAAPMWLVCGTAAAVLEVCRQRFPAVTGVDANPIVELTITLCFIGVISAVLLALTEQGRQTLATVFESLKNHGSFA